MAMSTGMTSRLMHIHEFMFIEQPTISIITYSAASVMDIGELSSIWQGRVGA